MTSEGAEYLLGGWLLRGKFGFRSMWDNTFNQRPQGSLGVGVRRLDPCLALTVTPAGSLSCGHLSRLVTALAGRCTGPFSTRYKYLVCFSLHWLTGRTVRKGDGSEHGFELLDNTWLTQFFSPVSVESRFIFRRIYLSGWVRNSVPIGLYPVEYVD